MCSLYLSPSPTGFVFCNCCCSLPLKNTDRFVLLSKLGPVGSVDWFPLEAVLIQFLWAWFSVYNWLLSPCSGADRCELDKGETYFLKQNQVENT